MKKTRLFLMGFLASMVFLSVPVQSASAANPDFSGKWVLNEEKSTMGERMFFASAELVVKQDAGTISIDRTRTGRDGQSRTMNETLNTDGTKNVSTRENGSTTTVATWSEDGKSLNLESEIEFNRQGETFTMHRSETWTQDSGGSVLTIESTSSSSRGENSVKLVYDKK
jgi:hypothetical protein